MRSPGRLLYVRDGNLWLLQGGTSRQFSDGGTWYQPSFSPDGAEIAYVYWTFNFSDIFVMSSDGAASRRLTRGQAGNIQDSDWAFRPRWSPDGSQIAYITDTNSQFPLVWLMSRDGGNRRQVLTPALGIEWADAISWAPDREATGDDGRQHQLRAEPDLPVRGRQGRRREAHDLRERRLRSGLGAGRRDDGLHRADHGNGRAVGPVA